ncbi:MAG: hypothetical protein U0625_09810 [Phycisphaerales bacterium]
MPYSIIEPPFHRTPSELSVAELKQGFDWYLQSIPRRATVLAEVMAESQGYAQWSPNYLRESLAPLGEWFETQIQTRPKSETEIEAQRLAFGHSIDLSGPTLNVRTLSLCVDVGMYLGETMRVSCPSLRWVLPLKSKRHIYYGLPCLAEFGKRGSVSTGMLVSGLAWMILRGERSGDYLASIHDLWIGYAGPSSTLAPRSR